ncbi:MAG: Bax inhibitor-1/YccA family protein [Verrucomicrobiia bacterium]|jgi:FtsH-binding integral membrane protein
MSQYISQGAAVIKLDATSRSRFINRTYGHLTAAIFAFAGLEIALFKTGLAAPIAKAVGGNFMLVMIAFMAVSWIASSIAHRSLSKAAQYMALGGFIVMEAIIFVPMLYMAEHFVPGAISKAAAVTFVGFGVLTAIVFMTGKDFSFLGGLIKWGFAIALIAVVGAFFFNWNLGNFFSVAMVGLAGASILYSTSNVLHHYPEDRYVAASLELFSSVALMLWYVLRIFMSGSDD